jgi:murein endopeptidase
MPRGPYWEVRDVDRSWGTRETVESLGRAIRVVAESFQGTPRLQIGDMSKKKGGYFRPHRSHQSGRDADIGYYYKPDTGGWYVKADEENLDVARTWALVKALIAPGNVEYVFIDRGVQNLLKNHAMKTEPGTEWLDDVFEKPGKKGQPVIRHTWGHRTHMHVRFYGDQAQETSRRTYKLLARYGKI